MTTVHRMGRKPGYTLVIKENTLYPLWSVPLLKIWHSLYLLKAMLYKEYLKIAYSLLEANFYSAALKDFGPVQTWHLRFKKKKKWYYKTRISGKPISYICNIGKSIHYLARFSSLVNYVLEFFLSQKENTYRLSFCYFISLKQ